MRETTVKVGTIFMAVATTAAVGLCYDIYQGSEVQDELTEMRADYDNLSRLVTDSAALHAGHFQQLIGRVEHQARQLESIKWQNAELESVNRMYYEMLTDDLARAPEGVHRRYEKRIDKLFARLDSPPVIDAMPACD